ncbi:HAD family hydrolase [Cyanobium sp. Cruz CV13-4-11]|uniref:HAD family hydrolase n=1 Tax=unclassified Cyanobium TaxID=2627006 RepID=UPI0020CF944E|nr:MULTISPECIES: HAD-IA family hydrolase [unclassified Cyanobium]MCP9901085.1 HAD family hydrolase [Cyanobium sp. Cruz CV11-17]MCP9920295.1 HAD family hydrolase [Cyanobium sp. Cruz CV13-4-11]
MVLLSLRGLPLPCGDRQLEAVLFDKDGTISHSEPMLVALAQARVFHCLALADLATDDPERHRDLGDLLHRAYGLASEGVHPAGTMAVASRDQNLVATATTLVQVGLGWPEALAMAEAVFARTDALHGQGSEQRPAPTAGLRPLLESLRLAGVRCAVISNDHIDGIEAFLAAHDLVSYVQAIWSAEHQPRKPDPAAVHGLCAELGVAVESCALIGDANSDLRMARAAGVPVVLGYRAGWRRPVDLDDSFLQLDHWKELAVVAEVTLPLAGPSIPGGARPTVGNKLTH